MQRVNKSLKIINQKIDLKGKKSNALKPLFELRNGQIEWPQNIKMVS